MIKHHFRTLATTTTVALVGGAVLLATSLRSEPPSPSGEALGIHVSVLEFGDHADGKREALRDLDAGKLAIKTYGMPSGSRMTYARILGDEYGIDLWTVAGCIVIDEITENAAGYNEVMLIAIEDRYGDDTLDDVWERAEQEHERELANAGR